MYHRVHVPIIIDNFQVVIHVLTKLPNENGSSFYNYIVSLIIYWYQNWNMLWINTVYVYILDVKILVKSSIIIETCSRIYVGVLISLWLFLFPVFLFATQPKEFFLDGLKKLEQRSHKCEELGISRVNTFFFNPVACFLYKAKHLSAPSYTLKLDINFLLIPYLLTYGADPFLRSCQLCSHSGNSQQF
jgi:hypothetical protein